MTKEQSEGEQSRSLFDIAPDPKSKPKRIQIAIADLHLKPHDDATDQIYLNRLAANINIWGVMNPLIVQPQKKGYLILAGRRRYLAVNLLIEGGLRFHNGERYETLEPQAGRFAKLPCVILPDLPGGDTASAAITLFENQMRRPNALAELDALLTMHTDGKDEKTIFRLTGMPSAVQRKRLKLHNLSAQMRKAMADGKLSNSNALAVASLSKDKQKQVWANYKNRLRERETEPNGSEKITSADIAAVRRVQTQQALSSLPGDVFDRSVEYLSVAEARQEIKRLKGAIAKHVAIFLDARDRALSWTEGDGYRLDKIIEASIAELEAAAKEGERDAG